MTDQYDAQIRRQVLEFTGGRWASMYIMVERIGPRADIIEAIRTLNHDENYQVRKRDPEDAGDDTMLREYRTFFHACKFCANRLHEWHKPSCKFAGKLVDKVETKEW